MKNLLFILFFLFQCSFTWTQSHTFICDPAQRIESLKNQLNLADSTLADIHFNIARNFVEMLLEDSASIHYNIAVNEALSDSARHFYQLVLSQHFTDEAFQDSLQLLVSETYDTLHSNYAILLQIKAFKLADKGQYDSATTYLNKAISILENHKDTHFNEFIHCRTALMPCLGNTDLIDSSIVYGRQLMKDFLKQFPECHYSYARILLALAKRFVEAEIPDSSYHYIQKSIKILDKHHKPADPNYALLYAELGAYYKQLGKYSMALSSYNDALEIGLLHKSSKRKFLSFTYGRIASIFRGMYNNEKALKYYNLSIQMLQEEYGNEAPFLFGPYTNMGMSLVAMKEYETASNYLDQALKYCLELVGEHHIYTAIITGAIASNASENGEFEKAEKYFQRSLKIRDHLFGSGSIRHANIYINISILYRDMKLYEKARLNLQKGLSIYKNKYGDKHPEISAIYNRFGLLYTLEENYEAALKAYSLSLKAGDHNNEASSIYDPLVHLTILRNRGDAYLKLYRKTLDQSYLSLAAADLEKGKIVLSNTFNSQEYQEAIIELLSRYREFFELGIEVNAEKFNLSKSAELLTEAWKMNDISKSVSIRSALASQNLISFYGIDNSTLTVFENLKSNLRRLQAIKNENESQGNLEISYDSIVIIQSQIDSIDDVLKTNNPNYYQAMKTDEPVPIDLIQNQLDPSEQIIDFFLSTNYLYVFTLTKEEMNWAVYPYTEKMSESTEQLIDNQRSWSTTLENDDANDYYYQILKNNIRPGISNLTIIPDQYLSQISFEALMGPDNSYLIEDYSFSYTHSLSIYNYQNQTDKKNNKYNYAGFAPIYEQLNIDTSIQPQYAELIRSGEMHLPFAQKEISAIKKLLNGKIYSGKNASKEAIFKAFKEAKIVHLSMHTLINPINPLNSRFVLNNGDQSLEDLFLYELYNLETNVDLAVLSACETGIGKAQSDGSANSLGNALAHSGIPASVISLWKVPDQSTSEIMTSFYRNLKTGQKKDEALRNAKIEFLSNIVADEQRAPFYWAGFVAVGNMDAITFNENNNLLWASIGILLLSLISLIFFRKRKK